MLPRTMEKKKKDNIHMPVRPMWTRFTLQVRIERHSPQGQPMGDCNTTYNLLLLGDTNDTTATAGSLGVLTTDTDAPVVTETTVSTDLLEAFQVLTHLVVKTVGQQLSVLAIDKVLLSVEEPLRDLVLSGVLHDGDEALELFVGKLTSSRWKKGGCNCVLFQSVMNPM